MVKRGVRTEKEEKRPSYSARPDPYPHGSSRVDTLDTDTIVTHITDTPSFTLSDFQTLRFSDDVLEKGNFTWYFDF